MDNPIKLSPSRGMTFNGPLDNIVTEMLTLYNKSTKAMAFKIFLTDSKAFNAKPDMGFIGPMSKISITITLLPQYLRAGIKSNTTVSEANGKNKLLMSCTVYEPSVTQGSNVTEFWKSNDTSTSHTVYQQTIDLLIRDDSIVIRKGGGASMGRLTEGYDEDIAMDAIDYDSSDSGYSKIGNRENHRATDDGKLREEISVAEMELKSAKRDRSKLQRVHREADKARSKIEADLKAYVKRGIRDRMQTMYAIQIFFMLFAIVLISYWVEEFLVRFIIMEPGATY